MLSCTSQQSENESALNEESVIKVFLNNVDPVLLDPRGITNASSWRVSSQIYEGLFSYNPSSMKPESHLISNYQIDSSGTVYSFSLKKGVFFHDDECFPNGKGRELIARDIQYCLLKAFQKDDVNWPEIQDFEILNDYDFTIQLSKPHSYFIHYLASPRAFIYPRESVEFYRDQLSENPVGTGPFELEVMSSERIVLGKNSNYHIVKDGNSLPYLKKIAFFKGIPDNLPERIANNEIDLLVAAKTDQILNVLEYSNDKRQWLTYEVQRSIAPSSHYLLFKTQSFGIDLRKAISFTLNRKRIVDFTLNGGADISNSGIFPPVFDFLNSSSWQFDLDSAQYYLNRARVRGGQNIGKLAIDFSSDRNVHVAREIRRQLNEYLNIDITIDTLVVGDEKYDVQMASAQYFYPDPFAFINDDLENINLLGPLRSSTIESTINGFDLELKKRVLAVPLWNDEEYRIINSDIYNLPNNSWQYWRFAEVHLNQARNVNSRNK